MQEIEPVRPRVVANDLSRVATGVAPDASASTNYLGLTGTNVLISMTDQGIDVDHPDLTGRVFPDTGVSSRDPDGHGTHIAGIMIGASAGFTLRSVGGSMSSGSLRIACEIAVCTSCAAESMSRSRLNWSVITEAPGLAPQEVEQVSAGLGYAAAPWLHDVWDLCH